MDEKKIQKSVLKNSCTDGEVGNYDVDEFPTGLKILIVDDDRICLLVLERMLRKLLYQVTKCQAARDALALLGENKDRFDIVICDLHMPDIDGFKLLEIIQSDLDLPVVMMSSDDAKAVVMKSIIHGACDYLVKPVRIEAIRLIWQHVVRKRKHCFGDSQQPGNDRLLLLEKTNDADGVPARDKANPQSQKRTREDEDIDGESSDEATTAKKPRMVWTEELHDVFVAAVNQLGRDKAVPKKILERMQAMNVTGVTRANIASHLQKYRMHLQKAGGIPSADNRDLDVFFKQASSFGPPNQQFQPAGTSCQLPLQNLITPQSCRFETGNESFSTGPSDRQGSNVFDFRFSESSRSCLPTEFSLHDLSRENLSYQNDFPGAVAISNEEFLYRNVGNFTGLSNHLYAVDELIYEPSVLVRQYQDDIFHGPFV